MTTSTGKDVYERKFLELLLRHELPDDAKVTIHVSEAAHSSDLGSVEFGLGHGGISVKGGLSQSGLRRAFIPAPPCW